MRATLATGILLLGTATGCGGTPSGPGDKFPSPVVPALESVPFELLGSGKIAFERIGGKGAFGAVYVVDASARTSAHYFDNLVVEGASMSPDGRRLAYTSFGATTNFYDAFVANIDGTGVVQVSSFAGQEGPPTWTPDGAKVLILGGEGVGSYQVYSQSPVANPTDRTQLTQFVYPSNGTLSCPLIANNDVRVSISAAGLLALHCSWQEIDVLTANGTLSASYAPARNDQSRLPNVVAPAWSPDGTRLAFIETTLDNVTTHTMTNIALKVMNADGTNVTTIVDKPVTNALFPGQWAGLSDYSLCWTGDGSRIVFTMPESALVGHLWVVRADGTGLAQLTSAPDSWDRSVSCTRS